MIEVPTSAKRKVKRMRLGLTSRSLKQAISAGKTTLAALLLTTIMPGCGSPPPGNFWVTSDDGLLALRLSAVSERAAASEDVEVVAQIRNASQQKLTILRPFGDWYAAKAIGMKIWDGERQIPYTGPAVTYVIGASAFAVIGPGEVVEDKLELTIDNFAGFERPGRYTLRYDYSYDGHWDATTAAGNSGIAGAWRGTITSREIQVVRK